MCSGKVYYELLEFRRSQEGLDHTAIVRIEQLYPFPEDDLEEVLRVYPKLQNVVWCQEEPQNQGAWYSTQHRMRRVLKAINEKIYLGYAGRRSSAAPAAGYISVHVEEQNRLIKKAFDVK
jgi:2-oxoglutarate dehydrogenase E1 component